MHFDKDRAVFVVAVGRELPVARHGREDTRIPGFSVTHFRQVVVAFENRWSLSIIWGDHTYSSNYHAWNGKDWDGNPVEWSEEPTMVEIGILMPEPVTVPARVLGPLPSTGQVVEIPEQQRELWGDPLAYVDAEALWWLAMDEVSKWPSENKPIPEDGPYLHAASPTGPFMLTVDEYETEKESS